MQDAYGLTADDVVLQKTPSALMFGMGILLALTGARLVMAPPGAHREPAQLVEPIRTYKITTLHFDFNASGLLGSWQG